MPMTDKQFLQIAAIAAESSHCVSLKVGAVLVRGGRVVSTGYNGTPPGFVNCNQEWRVRCDAHTAWSNTHEIHAEQNAIIFAARHGISTEGCTMYTTIEPCHQCVKLMIAAGITRVVYSEGYYREDIDRKAKQEFSDQCGMKIEHYGSESTTPLTHLQLPVCSTETGTLQASHLDTSPGEESRAWTPPLAGWATLRSENPPKTPSTDISSSPAVSRCF